jgi:hypothetical protein
MAPARHDPAARRQRLELRVSTLKRRLGIVSVLGFGALLGLVTQHAVGSQKHRRGLVVQPAATGRSVGSFFDANGPSYSFDDSGARAAQERSVQAAQQAQSAAPQQQEPQQPVAQSSGS